MGRAGRARRCHRALLVRLRTACRALATSWCAHRRATAGASGRLGSHRTTGCHLRLEPLSPGRWPAVRQPSPRPLVPLQKQRRRRRPAWPCGMAARGKTRPQRPLGGGSGPAARWPTSFCLRRAFLEAERASHGSDRASLPQGAYRSPRLAQKAPEKVTRASLLLLLPQRSAGGERAWLRSEAAAGPPRGRTEGARWAPTNPPEGFESQVARRRRSTAAEAAESSRGRPRWSAAQSANRSRSGSDGQHTSPRGSSARRWLPRCGTIGHRETDWQLGGGDRARVLCVRFSGSGDCPRARQPARAAPRSQH